jgi:DNA polymerase III epsilon subunit family exonuclease
MIQDTPFVVVDVETTGLEARLDRIVEIGAVKILNGKIIQEWGTLVNPGVFIPDITTKITGITTEMVKDAPRFEDIAEDFLKMIDPGDVFVAHNVDFDRNFVNNHLKRHEHLENIVENPYLCTYKLAKRVHPNLNKYSLGFLAYAFDVSLENAHRALDDARATGKLLIQFMDILREGGLKSLRDLPCIQNLPKKQKDVAMGQTSLF